MPHCQRCGRVRDHAHPRWSRILAGRSLIVDLQSLSKSPPLPVAHKLAIGRGGLCYVLRCNAIASVLFLKD
nr:MAG TPA: hypothetical protein [Herelleviridae sp.]